MEGWLSVTAMVHLLVAQSAAASALCELHFFLRQEIAGDFTLSALP